MEKFWIALPIKGLLALNGTQRERNSQSTCGMSSTDRTIIINYVPISEVCELRSRCSGTTNASVTSILHLIRNSCREIFIAKSPPLEVTVESNGFYATQSYRSYLIPISIFLWLNKVRSASDHRLPNRMKWGRLLICGRCRWRKFLREVTASYIEENGRVYHPVHRTYVVPGLFSSTWHKYFLLYCIIL